MSELQPTTSGPIYTQTQEEQAREYRPNWLNGYRPRQLDSVRLLVAREVVRRSTPSPIRDLSESTAAPARAEGVRRSGITIHRGATGPRGPKPGSDADRLMRVMASEDRGWHSDELAERTGVLTAQVGSNLNLHHRKGLVEVEPSPHRQCNRKLYRLTKLGRACLCR